MSDHTILEQTAPDGGNLRKPEIPLIFHWFARFMIFILGWRISGFVPDVDKFIVVAGPHTANRDGFMLIMTGWALRVRLDWMVKSELVRPPHGWFLRKIGAVPIDRKASHNVVDQAVEAFRQRDKMALVIAPEGTRKKSDHWKTGFYWIALDANVPMFMARLDYKRKVIDITDALFYVTGDIEADMDYIWSVYDGVGARFPEKVSDMRLRPGAARRKSKS